MLLSGALVCARQEGPCQRKVQIGYSMLEATGALSRWTRLGGVGAENSWGCRSRGQGYNRPDPVPGPEQHLAIIGVGC